MTEYLPAALLGWDRSETVHTYDRATLYSYINGAAEVFLAYDFRSATVVEYRRADHPDIKLELFDMGSAQEAYGIFSHSRDSEETGIGRGYEFRRSLLCFWQDRFFICVSSVRMSAEVEQAMIMLARGISDRLPDGGEVPRLLTALPEAGLVAGSVRYFHTHTSLNAHYYLSSDNILGLDRDTDAVLGCYGPDSAYTLVVQYAETGLAEEALRSFVQGYAPDLKSGEVAEVGSGKFCAAVVTGTCLIIVVEVHTAERATGMLVSARERLRKTVSEEGPS